MTKPELKSQLHKLIDSTDDEVRLKEALNLLSQEKFAFDVWDLLPEDYKKELMERADEIGDDSKWMSREEFFKRK